MVNLILDLGWQVDLVALSTSDTAAFFFFFTEDYKARESLFFFSAFVFSF